MIVVLNNDRLDVNEWREEAGKRDNVNVYRVDQEESHGTCFKLGFGKASFEPQQLMGNLSAFVEAVRKARPSAAKGTYIRKIVISSCMGPGIKVDPILAQGLEAA